MAEVSKPQAPQCTLDADLQIQEGSLVTDSVKVTFDHSIACDATASPIFEKGAGKDNTAHVTGTITIKNPDGSPRATFDVDSYMSGQTHFSIGSAGRGVTLGSTRDPAGELTSLVKDEFKKFDDAVNKTTTSLDLGVAVNRQGATGAAVGVDVHTRQLVLQTRLAYYPSLNVPITDHLTLLAGIQSKPFLPHNGYLRLLGGFQDGGGAAALTAKVPQFLHPTLTLEGGASMLFAASPDKPSTGAGALGLSWQPPSAVVDSEAALKLHCTGSPRNAVECTFGVHANDSDIAGLVGGVLKIWGAIPH